MISTWRAILLLAAEDAEVLEHRRRRARRGSSTGARRRSRSSSALSSRSASRSRDSGHLDRRVRERPLGGGAAGAPAERDRLHQRVAAEPVRAVHGDARRLAGGVEAGQLGARRRCRSRRRPCGSARPAGRGSGRRSGRRRRTSSRARASPGSRSMIRSAPRWRMSRKIEPLTPRPSSISVCSERETTSREASSIAFGA